MRRVIAFALVTIVLVLAAGVIWLRRPVETNPLVVEFAEPIATLSSATGPDSDGDGVPDEYDLCPGTIPGASGTDATGCPTRFDPEAELTFVSDKHQLWYRRYWTGSCAGLGFPEICLPGDPNWHHVVDVILDGMPPAMQGLMRNRMWSIGRAVAYHWSQGSDQRVIQTNDLRRWGDSLLDSDDYFRTIADIEDEICQMMGPDFFNSSLVQGEHCM